MSASTAEAIAALRERLALAQRLLVFSGAGLSTAAGIPDFRSPGGLWQRLRPIEFGEFMRSAQARDETWRRKFELDAAFGQPQPTAAHRAIAAAAPRLAGVVTQNIDGLHAASGVPADLLVELHGNGTYASCLSCGERHELADMRRRFEAEGHAPQCACGGWIKPATISFGQTMPQAAMQRAEQATREADLFLVLGSSLQVYPAAGFPELACDLGTQLVILNQEPTPLDGRASLVIHDDIDQVLPAALGTGCAAHHNRGTFH